MLPKESPPFPRCPAPAATRTATQRLSTELLSEQGPVGSRKPLSTQIRVFPEELLQRLLASGL